MRIGYEAIRMFISYPHARFLSTFEGNKLNRGHLRRQSTQGWCHRPQGWRHRPRGWQDRPDRWIPGPLHAQVNPTGGSPGGLPTLPPTRASAAPQRSPRATPDMKKAPPQECLFKNAEPPPVDRTEGGRCAPGGTRTPNLLNRNQMLYPLSYGRFAVWLSISLHASHRDAKSNDVA